MELNSNNEIEANITNHGNGPAIFEEFMIEYESVRYQGADIEKPITIILSTFKVKGYFLYTYNPNGVLGPNQKKNILKVLFIF